MSSTRGLGQRDANEPEIVKGLRAVGRKVQQLHQGGGVPDLLVFDDTTDFLCVIEVKDPTQPAAARKLKKTQVEWHAAWAGAPVFVVETLEEAIRVSQRRRAA